MYYLMPEVTGAVEGWWALALPTCRDVMRRIAGAAPQSWSLPRWVGIWLHLLACGWCRRYRQQLRRLRAARISTSSPASEAASIPAALSPAARQRLREALRRELESRDDRARS